MVKSAILLPILGREEFTERFLAYCNLIKARETLYLADGSEKKKFSKRYFSKNYPNLKIIYKKYTFDKNFYIYSKKMCKILREIKEEYVMPISNDDFYNDKFLREAEKFLDKKKDYSIVAGFVKNFRVIQLFKPTNEYGTIHFNLKNTIHYGDYGNIFQSVEHKDKNKRVFYFIRTLGYESLMRKSTLKKIWKIAYKLKLINSFEMNWCYNIIPLIDGKKKHLNLITQLRQSNTYNSLGLTDIPKKRASIKRYNKFIKLLKKERLITKKKTLSMLNKLRDNSLNIDDGKKNNLYQTVFPYYWQIKQIILKINYFISFLFLKKDNEEFLNKIQKFFNYTKVYNSNIKNNLK